MEAMHIARIATYKLYGIVRKKKDETGMDHYIERRGPVSQWSIKERRVLDSKCSQANV